MVDGRISFAFVNRNGRRYERLSDPNVIRWTGPIIGEDGLKFSAGFECVGGIANLRPLEGLLALSAEKNAEGVEPSASLFLDIIGFGRKHLPKHWGEPP